MIAGRQYLNALSQSVPQALPQYRAIAEGEWTSSNNVPDLNFGVEYLEDGFHPSFFHEFVESLEGSGLQYLCESSLGSMLINQFPAAMGSILPEDCSVVETEQYVDFITNRTRRLSILCRDDIEIDRNIDPSVCESLYFSVPGLGENPEEEFSNPEVTLNILAERSLYPARRESGPSCLGFGFSPASQSFRNPRRGG